MSHPSPKDKRRRDAVVALFLLSHADETAFSTAIYTAQQDAATAAYQDAADAFGADASDAALPDDVLSTLATNAQDSAASIVVTYNADLQAEAERFADAYQGDDLETALQMDLTAWAGDRAAWKSAQLAMYESGRGYSAGIDWMVSDALDGTLAFPDGISPADLVVTVTPSDSSNDVCLDYAGNSYPLDAAGDVLGLFPIHPNCRHGCILEFAN